MMNRGVQNRWFKVSLKPTERDNLISLVIKPPKSLKYHTTRIPIQKFILLGLVKEDYYFFLWRLTMATS